MRVTLSLVLGSTVIWLASCSRDVRRAEADDPTFPRPTRTMDATTDTDRADVAVMEPAPSRMVIGEPGQTATVVEERVFVLQGRERERLAGRRVDLKDAKVQRVSDGSTFWVGPSRASAIPVVLKNDRIGKQIERWDQVRQGRTVRIEGKLVRTRDAADALNLSPQERTAFLESPVYISATRVTPGSQLAE